MNEEYFDVILSNTNFPTEEEFENYISEGDYDWVLTSSLEKKIGHRIPGKDGIYYNIVDTKNGDYILNIKVDKKNIKISLNQVSGNDVQGLTEIYSVTSKLKTIADQMLLKSVPIPNFEKYLGLALELKVKYGETNPLEDKIVEDIDDAERKRINEQLSKLSDI